MNSTLTVKPNSDAQLTWPLLASSIIDTYLTRAFGGIGICTNLLLVIVLLHKSLAHRIYTFFWCRVVSSLIVSIFGVALLPACSCYDAYWLILYRLLTNLGSRGALIASFICDIFLMLDRYSEITKKKNYINKMPRKLNILIALSVGFIMVLPGVFSVNIYPDQVANSTTISTYSTELSQFGTSSVFLAYSLALVLVENVLPVLIMIFLNAVSVSKFKRLMYTHGHLTRNQTDAKKREVRFTKMILILSSICIVSRLMDMISSMAYRVTILNPAMFSQATIDLTVFFRNLTNLCLYAVNSLDALVYFKMDTNLWKIILNFFKVGKKVG